MPPNPMGFTKTEIYTHIMRRMLSKIQKTKHKQISKDHSSKKWHLRISIATKISRLILKMLFSS